MEQIERFKKRRENRRAVKAYKDRRAERLAYRIDDEPDSWITVRGNHIPLNEERKPIGGQVKAFGEKTVGAVRNMAEKVKEVNAAVNDKIYQMEHKKESEGEYYSLGGNSAPDETPYLKYTPKRDDYQDADSMNDFIHKNRDALQEIYDEGGMEAVDREYYLHMMSGSTKELKEINPEGTDFTSSSARRAAIESAMDDLTDEVGDSKLAGWTRNADSSYKPVITESILGSKKARNAALNLMYQNYLTQTDIDGGKKMTYDEWLTTPVTLYRGEHGQKRTKDDVFSAYSFDRKMAESFGGDVKTIRIRPIDTLGSPRCKAEAEVMVPYWAEKKSLFDENDLRTDADDGQWITTENGHHVHLNEEGQPDKGNEHVVDTMTGKAPHKIAEGKDITTTWKRRPTEFSHDIEDVLNAQGFDGNPRVVDAEEFDQAVKAANGGKGFIAQRSYTAPDPQTAEDYRDQLYNGKFYVLCEGGERFGQGMYCSADYTGELTDGIQKDMYEYENIGRLSSGSRTATTNTETFTLDPSAKIASFSEISDDFFEYRKEMARKHEQEAKDEIIAKKVKKADREEIDKLVDAYLDVYRNGTKALKKFNGMIKTSKIKREDVLKIAGMINAKRIERAKELPDDVGTYAAMRGYDAINADKRGHSGSYTVVLNRTKCIFKRPDGWHKDAKEESKTEFRYNEKGELEAWRDGKLLGVIRTTGDNMPKNDSVERFKERRRKRLDARMDEEDTGWRTTDEGHKIHINEEGEVDKGNPYVLEKINGAKKIKSKTPKMFPRAGKNGSKHERLWGKTIDFINAQKEADPACADLFDAMQDHDGAFIYNISYGISQGGVDDSKISRYVRRSDGVVTKAEVKVPDVGKFDSPGGYGTYIHEMTHVMDVTTYSDDGSFTREAYSGRLELPSVREQRAKPNYGMPDDVAEEAKKEKKLFADAANEYRKSFREAESGINEEYLKGPQTSQARLEKDYRIRKENDRLYNEYLQKVADVRKRYADSGFARMFDLYDALSAGEVMDSGLSAHGHGRAYYSSEADRRMEILANYVALGVAHPDMFKAFKRDQPKLCEDLDKMVREMAGRLRK